MARISGRNLWIAIPAGVICAAVVGTLAYLSAPMVPVAASWVGSQFYNATHMAPPVAAVGTADRFAAATGSDCRSLYPDSLWSELVWTPEVLLAQSASAPAAVDPALVAAMAPSVRVSCTWTAPAGAVITTTVAAVSADAASVAQAALVSAGFACDTSAGLECSRTQGEIVEEHVVRGDLWISSVETAWHPRDYSDRIVSRLWP